MIRGIKLRNFQAHRRLRIVFSRGITTIKGPTDVGKSAIIRAIRWAVLNNFQGDEFISWGAKDAIVKLLVDKHVLTRRKGKGGNLYKLDDKVFRAFGNNVPEEIAKLLALDRLNFQYQLDPHLWFQNTPGEVSRQLNKVIDLSVIDTSLAAIASRVRKCQDRKDFSGERLEGFHEQMSILDKQRRRIVEFRKLKGVYGKVEKLEADRDCLAGLVKRARASQPERLFQKASEGQIVVSAFRSTLASSEGVRGLGRLIQAFEEAERLANPPPPFSPLQEAYDELHQTKQEYLGIRFLIRQYDVGQEVAAEREKEAADLETEFHKQIKGTLCPLCKSEIQ